MQKPLHLAAILLAIGAGVFLLSRQGYSWQSIASREGFEEDMETILATEEVDPYAGWVRPAGPPSVALQAGHWKNKEVPDELENLRHNGAYAAGKYEWEVNLVIAERAKALLEKEGVVVEILPTTVPPRYWADVFVSIHADDAPNRENSGYKVAAPWRDRTGKAERLADAVETAYGESTGMELNGNVSANMRGYYAFNWRRYEHALHPMTTAMILETGFLSSAKDRKTIVSRPEVSARGIADGVLAYLRSEGLLEKEKDLRP